MAGADCRDRTAELFDIKDRMNQLIAAYNNSRIMVTLRANQALPFTFPVPAGPGVALDVFAIVPEFTVDEFDATTFTYDSGILRFQPTASGLLQKMMYVITLDLGRDQPNVQWNVRIEIGTDMGGPGEQVLRTINKPVDALAGSGLMPVNDSQCGAGPDHPVIGGVEQGFRFIVSHLSGSLQNLAINGVEVCAMAKGGHHIKPFQLTF